MQSFKIRPSITSKLDPSLDIYLKEINKRKVLNKEEELELINKIQLGDEKARNKLIESNLRFVISIAKQYQNKGLSLVDLIQEGTAGLINSVDKFDPNKEVKFISYAVWWIRQAIIKAIYDQGKTVRVPISQIVSVGKINKVIDDYYKFEGRLPSFEEISESSHVAVDKINSTLNSVRKQTSIDTPIKEDLCLGDMIADTGSITADEELIKSETTDIIDTVLDTLPDRDHDILRLAFGLKVDKLSYYEIGQLFGLTSERVRQLVHLALNKLKRRHKSKLKGLL